MLAPTGFGCVAPTVHALSEMVQGGDKAHGITYYIGGAGPAGHVGSIDVPEGLQDAGYRGFVEVFTWQGMTHAGDQISLSSNRNKASELAYEIRLYARQFPGRKINIIALSAGTNAQLEKNKPLPFIIWNLAIAALAALIAYFLAQMIL